MSHLRHHHKEAHKVLEEEWAEISKNQKRRKLAPKRRTTTRTLHGVQMSGPKLETISVRLITEHRLPFATLDYGAMRDLLNPYLDKIPEKER